MMSLKLIYFKMRALAEAPQMLMRHHNVAYDYVMSWDHFDDVWANVKPTIAFRQLPMLEVDGTHQICQSIAIMSYIERYAGIALTDPVQKAQAAAITQSAQELFAPLNPAVNFAVGDDFTAKREAMRDMLVGRFADLVRCLDVYEGRFFFDDMPRSAEFAAYHHLDLSRHLDPGILSQFPRLEAFVADIEALPAIAAYLAERPALIDVGIAPKLVIEGAPHPTGVHKT